MRFRAPAAAGSQPAPAVAMLPGMRTMVLVAALMAAVVLGGCAAEKARVDQRRQDLSAAALGVPSSSLLRHLTPEERDALDRAGMTDRVVSEEAMGGAPDADGEDDLSADEVGDDEPDSTSEKAGKIGIAVLQVGLTLGMLAAPFFMF